MPETTPPTPVVSTERKPSAAIETPLERRARSVSASATLAAAGGFLDAFTYVGHGHVFANAMTGNVILLGMDLMSDSWRDCLSHLLPIMMFLTGVASAKLICGPLTRGWLKHPGLTVLIIEIVAFFSLGWLPPQTPNYLLTMSIAYVASLQMATFRDLNGRSYSSTFTTGNLRTMIENGFDWLFMGRQQTHLEATRDFAAICLMFLLGALLGAYATPHLHNRALWIDVTIFAALLVWLLQALLEDHAPSPQKADV